MGVSIQTYRVRIGTFNNPSVRVKTEKEGPETKLNAIWNYRMIISILLLLGFFSLLVYSCQHNFRMYPSLYRYPPTTAKNNHFDPRVYILHPCFNVPYSAPPLIPPWSALSHTWTPPRSTPMKSIRSSHKKQNKLVKNTW